MATANYQRIVTQVQELELSEQFRLLKTISNLIQHEVAAKPSRSILELKGLGKKFWRKIDIEEYLEQERNSWNG
jgi:hypothetical protein